MRTYKKRTKSTKIKTYQDYLDARAELLKKGINLQAKMSETSFNEVYKRIRRAKREGEIKIAPWQYLMRKERYIVSRAQAKALLEAAKAMEKEQAEIEGRKAINIRLKDIYTFSNSQIAVIGTYLTQNKQTIFGGRYE